MTIGRLLPMMAVLATFVAMPNPVLAQAPVLLQLRSGSPGGDRVVVDSAGGFVARGTLGHGIIPAVGGGERMMWYPYKGAFRAGGAGSGASTAWDDANVGFYSWAGGLNNQGVGYASVALGSESVASGSHAVAIGSGNTASGTAAFAVGVAHNCTGFSCTAMGYSNRSLGQGSVAIGYRVNAGADYTVALGYRAHANNTGSIVFGDASTTDSIRSSANNQFSVRAAGGYRLFTNATLTAGVTLNNGGSAWNVVSDRNRKESFLDVDGEDILARIRAVPVTSWNYIEEGRDVRHIGPMAQDWHNAFRLNDDSLTINQGDFDGVNLAAIQALEARTQRLQDENAELRARVERLERLLEALKPSP